MSNVLAACDSQETDPEDDDTEPLATTWAFDESQCASAYPIPLTVTTTVDSERSFVQNVVACTSDARYGPVWLHNIGHEIWRFNSGGAEIDFIEFTDESAAFAEIFDNPPILVPDDELVIHATLRRVSWTLDKPYTIAWETQSEGIQQLEDYGQDAVFLALLRKGSPERAALIACTLTAYDVAAEWSGDPDGFTENFEASLSTGAGAAGCTTKWQSAWGERFKPTAQFLDDADTSFRLLSRLGRLAVLLK